MRRDLRFEVLFDVPAEQVWHALTDPTALSQWLMRNDFVPRVGQEFRFHDTPRGGWDGVVHCRVLELVPGKRLSYTWKSDALDTTVTWTVEERGSQTRLLLEHQGFKGLKAYLVGTMLNRGWRRSLLGKRLPEYLGAKHVAIS
jgi:uncharacterized protein YndB with AHSA1/START domain